MLRKEQLYTRLCSYTHHQWQVLRAAESTIEWPKKTFHYQL